MLKWWHNRKENDKQTHFIRNQDAPIEKQWVECENDGWHENFWGFIVDTNPRPYVAGYSEDLIGAWYAHHEDEFWKYHQYNKFNEKWLKHYQEKWKDEDIFGGIK